MGEGEGGGLGGKNVGGGGWLTRKEEWGRRRG